MSPKPSPKIATSTRRNLSLSSHVQRHFTDAEQQLLIAFANRIVQRREASKGNVNHESRRSRRPSPSGSATPLWMPRVDIFDDPDCEDIIATFELPGVAVRDMNVNIVDGKLVVEGTRQIKVKPLNSQYSEWATADGTDDGMDVDNKPVPRIVVGELRYGKFKRDNIPLPNGVQKSDVTASLQNGMLKVTWPRQASTKGVTQAGNEPLTIKGEDPSNRAGSHADTDRVA